MSIPTQKGSKILRHHQIKTFMNSKILVQSHISIIKLITLHQELKIKIHRTI